MHRIYIYLWNIHALLHHRDITPSPSNGTAIKNTSRVFQARLVPLSLIISKNRQYPVPNACHPAGLSRDSRDYRR